MADIIGTTGQDFISGTNEADRITGYAGNDILLGQGGDDVIFGDGEVTDGSQQSEGSDITFADNDGLYDISDATQVTLNLSDFTHSTGYNTSIGYYITYAEGNVIKSVVIAPNVKDLESLEVNIDTLGGANLGTFIIVDGSSKGFEAGDVDFNFDGSKPVVSQTTATGTVSTDWVYFSQQDVNQDSKDHKAIVGNRESWEDMYNLGDNDKNDTAYNLSLTKTVATDGRITTTDGTYDVSGQASVTLDFSDFSHSTGFHSSIGYMLQDADGNIIGSYVAISNVKQMHEHDLGESLKLDIDTEGAVSLSTFLIVDGASKGFDIGAVDIDLSGSVPTVSQGKHQTDWIYFSNQSLNKDGHDHMLEGGNRFYWEDLNNLGDHDFGDTVYNLDVFENTTPPEFVDKSSGLYDIAGETEITLNFSEFTHSTGFHNSVGYYILDEDGNVVKAVVVAPDVKNVESLIVDVETEGGVELGTFLIVDGHKKGFEAGTVDLSFDGDKPVVTQTTETGTVHADSNWLYFSDSSENADGKEHKAIVGNREAWEDWHNLGDDDKNDTAYTLDIQKGSQTPSVQSPDSTNNTSYSYDDLISGGDGNDTIYGGLGNDTIYGGAGEDRIFGDNQGGKEVQAVEPAPATRLKGDEGSYDVSGSSSVTLDFSDFSHGTGYQNSIGYMLKDADGNIINAYIAIANVKHMGDSYVLDIDTEGAASLSTFIIVDGAWKGFDIGEVSIEISDAAVPSVAQGNVHTDWIYFSDESLNKDGKDHLAEGGNRFYWEDLNNLGDHDFDDTVYNLNVFDNSSAPEFADTPDGMYDISGESTVTLNFSEFAHSTGYKSSIGYYIRDEDGNVIKAVIVAPNVKDVDSLIVDVDTEGGVELGTFIIVDGHHKGFEAGEVNFDLDAYKPIVSQTTETGTVKTDWVYFSETEENADGKDHKVNVGNQEAWEDLWNLGDKDMNDTAYTLDVVKGSESNGLNGGVSSVTYNDNIYGGADNDTIQGGLGDDVIRGESGDDLIYGDTGIQSDDLHTTVLQKTRITTENGSYDIANQDTIELDFSDFSHGTGYQSSVGYMLHDADGNVIGAYVVIANVKQMHEKDHSENRVIQIETEGAVSLSTFLIVDGAWKGFDVGEVALNLSDISNPVISQGTVHTNWVYFSEASLNQDGKDHHLEGGNRFYWEDLKNLGDHDFDDTVYNLNVSTVETVKIDVDPSLASGNDAIDGGDGDDTIYGEGGDDIIFGGAGNDVLFGGAGDDFIYGGDGDDILQGGLGSDSLYGGAGNDYLQAGYEDDFALDGGTGMDIYVGSEGNDTLYFDQEDFSDLSFLKEKGNIYIGDRGFDKLIVEGDANVDFTGVTYGLTSGLKPIAQVEAVVGDEGNQTITANAFAIQAQSDPFQSASLVNPGDWNGFVAYLGEGDDAFNLDAKGWVYDSASAPTAELSAEMINFMGLTDAQADELDAYVFESSTGSTITIWTDAEDVALNGNDLLGFGSLS
ncbi:VCBS protein [Grimontia indica]|uniref:VCBS protein n=1 Tax=Grimontia indica TaxID=1056512 RepID=R1J0H2_9GAMM|nr:DUF4114 domain-containing protein [Grimontia indica]EOD81130.1 VCBS protein [Grimontia indica]